MTAEGAVQIRIRDISAAGAQIWAERPIPANCDALFKCGRLFAAARVVWCDERRARLSFYREVTLDEFDSSLRSSGRA
jgi:hypothetical protein